VTLIEGKNRQIRRMFEEIGHHVEKIKRVRYGPLELDVLPGNSAGWLRRKLQNCGPLPSSTGPSVRK
jgi:23S rRNA pseudouridine2605 synthase